MDTFDVSLQQQAVLVGSCGPESAVTAHCCCCPVTGATNCTSICTDVLNDGLHVCAAIQVESCQHTGGSALSEQCAACTGC